ncbi:MAG: hypothetical protein HKN70_07120, partial [Gammaproteobacteria bacterium]|nr:hypothetical protein [Gammaproteobacteria bacterium]
MTDYVCDSPIDTLTFIWDGTEDVRIKAWKGDVGSELLADIDGIVPGEEISVSGFAGSPNDVYFEVFAAGTDTKLGESNFHLSCSDNEMDGPEDCGAPQGDGKSNDAGLINSWLLEGIIDQGGTLDCTQPPTTGSSSCEFQSFPANCDTIDNVDTLTLVYSGGSCADSQNDQGTKFVCSGAIDGTLPALVTLANGDSFTVAPGEAFTIPESGSGTEVTLSNAGGTQILDVHTSCSAPLATGDIYGAATLQLINGMGAGTDVIYSYKITNTGASQITSLSAVDVPLGPLSGLPATLDPGEMVTVFNTVFIDTTTNSSVIVDAVDSAGASCSAMDTVDVTIHPPPPCEIVGEGVLELTTDKVKWKLENAGASSATIESITITWPQAIAGDLLEIKFDGDKIYDIDTTGGTLTLGPGDWINDPSKRVINPGDLDTLEIKFANDIDDLTGQGDYDITVNFEEGCSVTYVNTGLPFDCTKPIDELTMIWDGASEPIQVKAWKGTVGSELLLDQSGITAGTEVTVSGYAGSPNDVFWEIFSGGTKIGESNFHMSCSDNDMGGADDCGKRQGDGKSNDAGLINDWILEGMVDADGPFDCTP